MSQQTQVARVVDYHKRWIERWPTVQVASRADLHSPCRHERVLCLRSASNLSSLCLVMPGLHISLKGMLISLRPSVWTSRSRANHDHDPRLRVCASLLYEGITAFPQYYAGPRMCMPANSVLRRRRRWQRRAVTRSTSSGLVSPQVSLAYAFPARCVPVYLTSSPPEGTQRSLQENLYLPAYAHVRAEVLSTSSQHCNPPPACAVLCRLLELLTALHSLQLHVTHPMHSGLKELVVVQQGKSVSRQCGRSRQSASCRRPGLIRHPRGVGLGYYRRAGYLLDGARHVVEKCGGEFPSTARELQRIPGALG